MDPTECKHHQWVRDEDGDYCGTCGQSWLEWTRGFGSNVTPMKKKAEPLATPLNFEKA